MPKRTKPPTLLAVGGLSRSGTTMLVSLLNSHPDIRITHEMKLFVGVGKSVFDYWGTLPKFFDTRHHLLDRRGVLSKLYLLFYYLLTLAFVGRVITVERIRRILSWMWREHAIVGDKFPRYWFFLPQLITYDNFKTVMDGMYRLRL